MKEKVVYITGGARSGKSAFAEKLMLDQGQRILYIATALALDGEMEERIKRHRERRPSFWQTLEAYKDIGYSLEMKGERYHGILLDCITVMITNLLMDMDQVRGKPISENAETMEKEIIVQTDAAVEGLRKWCDFGVIVSNEVGMGLVPDNPLGRLFRDIAGRVNQRIASEADVGYLMVSGIPIRFK